MHKLINDSKNYSEGYSTKTFHELSNLATRMRYI